ncbi:MAG: hypothetical protein COC24_019255 [Alphaproteobacteria bacterium]|nr:hypothetical protein [Alphaproteobacteria bacterium]
MSGLNGGELTELIELQQKVLVTGEGGISTGDWVDVQPARAKITPLREKLELKSGGRANGQHFKVVVYGKAFGVPHVVTVRDQFIWKTSGDRVLRIDVITERPVRDNALEFECYLDG